MSAQKSYLKWKQNAEIHHLPIELLALMDSLANFVQSISYKDSLLVICGAGLLTHLIFKRTETKAPLNVVILLGGVPAALSTLLTARGASLVSALATSGVIFWGTLATSVLTYRLSPWHPLAKYPGPILNRISRFRIAILSTSGKQHEHYYELHEKYGDVVRVGPNELSFRNVNAVKDLMGPNGLPKGPFWDGRIPRDDPSQDSLIGLRDKMEHTHRRRPWTRAFNSTALKDYEPLISERANQLAEHLGNQKGPLDLTVWLSYFTYDMMGDLAFGGGTEMMKEGDVDKLWHRIDTSLRSALFMSHIPWLGSWFFKLPFVAKDLKEIQEYGKNRAVNRKLRGSTTRDLFTHLIDEDGVLGETPSIEQVGGDGLLAIIAGSDTTSSALANLFWYLMINPENYKRLQAEIDESDDNLPDFTRQAHMPYLNAALNEALRLLPPVLSGSQRYVNKTSMIGPNVVPQGTSAFIHFYSLQRDPRYFSPLPNSFIPERWLSEKDQLKYEPAVFKDRSNVILDQDAFIPFSIGPSNCAGKNFALMEMRMVICTIMQKFDMKLQEGFIPRLYEESVEDYFAMTKGQLPVVLTPRK